MLGRSDTAIIIPSYNEAATILNVVNQVIAHGHPIVVDDMSKDDTELLLKKNKIENIRNKRNEGYDQSLNIGFSYALKLNFKYAITFDADGQHDHNAIPLFIKALKEGNDLVVGIRPYSQRVSESIFSFFCYLRFQIRDPLCGMKGYNLDSYKELGHFDSYNSIGTELLLFMCKKRKKKTQIMINQNKRIGRSKLGSNIKINFKIFRSMIIAFYKWF